MNKLKKILIVFLILILIIILGFIMNLEKYDNFSYDLKVQKGFVPEKIEKYDNYQLLGGIKYSVEDSDEAISYIEKSYNEYEKDGSKLLKLELVEDEKFYYSVNKSYTNENNVTYDNTYVFFKRNIIDIDNNQINLKNIENKEEIQTIFNIYNYVYRYENKSYKIEKSEIKEKKDKYVYTIYFYEIVYGDWGIRDEITYYKQNIVVNKNDGKYNIEEKVKIKEFQGKNN